MGKIKGEPSMTLTKASIIEMVAAENGWSQKQSSEYVELLLEIMKRTLESGEDLLISGFGKFSVKNKKARRGRNPATNEDLMLEPRRVVTFKCSGKLRDRINNNG
jgi:integration host factor subunit alpha